MIRGINSIGFFVFLVYVVEFFETKNRTLGSSLSMNIAMLFLPLWISIKDFLIDEGYNPVYTLIPFALLSLGSTFFLRETFGVEIS